MNNKKGFTLIEILAVIILLGIISSFGITAIIKSRNEANKKLAQKLEQSLTDVGKEYYIYETTVNKKTFNDSTTIVQLKTLKDAGYLKGLICKDGICEFQSPSNGMCPGYLRIDKTSDGPDFKGYIKCDGLYTTDGFYDNKVQPITESETPEETLEPEGESSYKQNGDEASFD